MVQSILGFHTQANCSNFLESVDRFLEARIDRERQAVVIGGARRWCVPTPFPSSGRVAGNVRPRMPRPVAAQVRADFGLPPDALLGVGVDRLDYTKGHR